MKDNDIERVIKDHIVKEFMYDEVGTFLDGDEPLIRPGIIDSLGIFRLIAFLEERFGIKIQAEDVVLEKFETVNAIKNLVMAKLPKSEASY